MFLEIEKINKYYGEGENRNHVLKDVTTGVEKGKICVLLGPSGSGKSTLLNIIGGIGAHRDSTGTVCDIGTKHECALYGAADDGRQDRQAGICQNSHQAFMFGGKLSDGQRSEQGDHGNERSCHIG